MDQIVSLKGGVSPSVKLGNQCTACSLWVTDRHGGNFFTQAIHATESGLKKLATPFLESLRDVKRSSLITGSLSATLDQACLRNFFIAIMLVVNVLAKLLKLLPFDPARSVCVLGWRI